MTPTQLLTVRFNVKRDPLDPNTLLSLRDAPNPARDALWPDVIDALEDQSDQLIQFMGGAYVEKEEFDDAIAERDALQDQITELTAVLERVQTALQDLDEVASLCDNLDTEITAVFQKIDY